MKFVFVKKFIPRRKYAAPSSKALKELVDRCKQGDETAWSTLYTKYVNLVRSIASSPSWDFRPSVQEELVQEVFLKLIEKLNSLKKPSALGSYIASITKNVCILKLRKKVFLETPTPDMDCLTNPRAVNPESRAIRKEQWELIDHALAIIKERCQKLIRYYYGEGKTYKEIAAALQIDVNRVGVYLSRCLKQLKTTYLKQTGKIP